MPSFRPITLLLLLLLPGCRRPDPADIYVAPGVPFRLCAPEAAADFFVNQEVVFGLPSGRRETVLATVENQAGALNLVASTAMGQTLFIVKVRDGAVTVDARVPLPDRLDPRVLPALVQFALWPAPALRANLRPGIRLEEDGARRTLLRKDKAVWSVTREGAAPPYRSLFLEQPGMGITLSIRTLEE